MRRLHLFSRFALAAALMFLLAACGAEAMQLDQALSTNRVTADFTVTSTSGDVVFGDFTHSSGEAVNVETPAGLILRNSDAQGESFVIVRFKGKVISTVSEEYEEASSFVVSGNSTYNGLFEAYSINAFNPSPDASSEFTIDGFAAGNTKTVVDTIVKQSEDDRNIQANQIAIWATTDDLTREDAEGLLGADADQSAIDAARQIIQDAGLNPSDFQVFN